MNVEQVDHLHQTLSAELLAACTEASGTTYDAAIVARRLFSHSLAAYVAAADLPRAALRSVIETYCGDAAALARDHVCAIRGYETLDEETEPV